MKLQLPPILETKLADFRRSVWRVKLAEAFLGAFAGLIGSYLLVFVCDRFTETPQELRAALLACGGASLLLGVPLKWYRWVWCQRRLEDAARLLKRTFPRLGDQLLGLVELAHQTQGVAGRSERLVQAALAQAADSVKDRDFRSAVPDARHVRWAWIAALLVLATACVSAWTADGASNALARWAMPWRATERFTFTRVESLPDRLVVPIAEPFSLPVRLAGDTQQKPALGTARIARQPLVTGSLSADTYPLAFPPQKTDAELRVFIGDLRKAIRIEPKQRPELSALSARLSLPAYLQYTSEVRMDIRGGSVPVLRGARVAFEATVHRPLALAHLDAEPLQVEENRIQTPFAAVTEDAARQLTWKDADGLTPRDPLILKIHATEDEAPRLSARRDSLEQVVLDSEVLNFDITTSDDFGIRAVGLEWNGMKSSESAPEPIHGEKITAAGNPERREMTARATFCAAREGITPQTLEIRAWCTDYLPERKRVVSPVFVVHVLNKTDHAMWLIEQFGKWLTAAHETYDREQQLHESNQELRQMSAAELDRAENRRRISQQANAESANAARLDALTSAGRNLVQQATRNDEFDAARLETWATMLQSLKDISKARMPSVASLLKQSSNADTASRSAQPGTPAQTGPSPQQPSAGQRPLPSNSAPSKPAGPMVSQGDTPPQNQRTSSNTQQPNAPPKPPAPGISDKESSLSAPNTQNPQPTASAPKPSSAGRLSLPQTQLGAVPGAKKEEANPPAESPAQEKMDQALTEQKDLLEEFARVSEQLNKLLGSFETSTFVKRLKHASRKQMAIAKSVSQKTLDAFGVSSKPVPESLPIADNATEQSEFVGLIQRDLEAYAQRKQDSRFTKLLEEMRTANVTERLARNSKRLLINFSGQTLSSAEFWADTLDRWSEELVSASNCKSCSSGSSESLPPEIVLKVMKALQQEIQLRDQTREAESAREALEAPEYTAGAKELGTKQDSIAALTAEALRDILQIPQAEQKFTKELRLLNAVVNVMREAEGILNTPDTGARSVAAETEAIELLLQAKRGSPKGGGGGGGSPGGGGTVAFASTAALAEIGSGNTDATMASRPVGQATGQAGKEFPAEFKTGLDAYFNRLENAPR